MEFSWYVPQAYSTSAGLSYNSPHMSNTTWVLLLSLNFSASFTQSVNAACYFRCSGLEYTWQWLTGPINSMVMQAAIMVQRLCAVCGPYRSLTRIIKAAFVAEQVVLFATEFLTYGPRVSTAGSVTIFGLYSNCFINSVPRTVVILVNNIIYLAFEFSMSIISLIFLLWHIRESRKITRKISWGDIRTIMARDNTMYFTLTFVAVIFNSVQAVPTFPFGLTSIQTAIVNSVGLMISTIQKVVWTPRLVLQLRQRYSEGIINEGSQYQDGGRVTTEEVGTMVFAGSA